jgi:hypothetical protein
MGKRFSVSELITMQEEVSRDTREIFAHLISEQLNWKPSAEEWSVGQCFDHLINTNTPYFPELENIIRGAKTNTVWQKLPFFPGFFGRFVINAANPENAKKVKAPSVFRPSSSNIDAKVMSRFIESQHRLVELMKATEKLPVADIIITSPVAAIVAYSLLDAYTIMALHNRRHFNQAKRVMESQEFPGAVAKSPAFTEAGI